jgi:small subunit ribosomal protein S30e
VPQNTKQQRWVRCCFLAASAAARLSCHRSCVSCLLWCCPDGSYHVFIVYWLHVGKVHGSLARAGKVRGQTPKVPKQEKSKKPCGRAGRRLKYNRRFVNVGERRGCMINRKAPKTIR